MADLRTARRTAEQLARDALGGTLLRAAGELGVALARRAEAAEAIAAAAEKAREIVRAAEAEAGAVVDRAAPGSHLQDERQCLTLDAVYGRTHPARADPRLPPTPGHPGQPHHPAGGHPVATVSASTSSRGSRPGCGQSRRAVSPGGVASLTGIGWPAVS
jgi:hypothetical protein